LQDADLRNTNLADDKTRRNDPQVSICDASVNCVQSPAAALAPGEIHVWQFPLTASESAFEDFTELLSSDERMRASRFHFEKDARRFTIARASMRIILAAYSAMPARDLRFVDSKNGKPALASAAVDIHFNLSHSGNLGLLGVALGREVGVDIEVIRSNIEIDQLAERFFSAHECESLRGLLEQERIAAFFRCWTCKEAFLKAQGVGLSRSLASFDVEVNPAQPACLLATRPDEEEAARWSLYNIGNIEAYAAAVAVAGSVAAVKIMRCQQL
jgi:4'-phosphopantetheinyl transferase